MGEQLRGVRHAYSGILFSRTLHEPWRSRSRSKRSERASIATVPQRPRAVVLHGAISFPAGVGGWKRAVAGEGDAAALAGAGQEDLREERANLFRHGRPTKSSPTRIIGKITATVEMPFARIRPSRCCCDCGTRKASPMKSVTVNGAAVDGFRPGQGSDFPARRHGDC